MEFAAETGTLAPSVDEVRALLEQDRIRQAVDRADALARQYRGPQTDLVYGWALWRNGDVRGAEPRFRRAAEAGLDEGLMGLAAVRASTGDWPGAVELASSLVSGPAHALLASAAWMAGERDAAVRELQAWNVAEAGTARGRAAAAMAVAAARLEGPTQRWEGDAVVLPLRQLDDGGWAVQASVDGVASVWRIDLTFRQSMLSERVAATADRPVDGASRAAARTASARWPAMLSARQAAVARLDFGGVGVRNVVVAVGELPAGVDGILAADLLSSARWSVTPGRREMVLAPPEHRGDGVFERASGARTIAWVRARVVREGLGAQILLFPRVSGTVVAAGLDLDGISRLDADILPVAPGSGTALAPMSLGGWRGEVLWRPASLAGWAVDGGVAPTAVIGANLLSGWSVNWYPASGQLRVDADAAE